MAESLVISSSDCHCGASQINAARVHGCEYSLLRSIPKSNLFESIWLIESITVVTSAYCAEEARRNLRTTEQLARLSSLLAKTLLVDDCSPEELPTTLMLPAKDLPVMAAAARCQADILITGDRKHFSHFYGHRLLGALVESPATFLTRFSDLIGS